MYKPWAFTFENYKIEVSILMIELTEFLNQAPAVSCEMKKLSIYMSEDSFRVLTEGEALTDLLLFPQLGPPPWKW